MSHSAPEDRIELFTARLEELCDEAGLPQFDRTEYVAATGDLAFLWTDPEFCLVAPLRRASIYGMDAAMLRGAWNDKFGGNRAQRRARKRA